MPSQLSTFGGRSQGKIFNRKNPAAAPKLLNPVASGAISKESQRHSCSLMPKQPCGAIGISFITQPAPQIGAKKDLLLFKYDGGMVMCLSRIRIAPQQSW